MRASKSKIIIIGFIVVLSIPVILMLINKGAPVAWGWWGPVNADNGVAIQGYDAVAYFKEGKATKGNMQHGVQWKGVEWYFASAENKNAFEIQPENYAPQYGGYCSTAVSAGITFDTDPQSWLIQEGKLYLFFDDAAKADWQSKLGTGVIAQTDRNWSSRIE